MEDKTVLQRLLALGYQSFKIVRQSPHSGVILAAETKRRCKVFRFQSRYAG